jgi:leader peptidase (prepilin peptidase)/N-methyltransferase
LLLNPRAVGMGDIKLGLLLGAALGADVLSATLIGFLAIFPFALVLLARHGSAARRAAVPLGPFLALGTVATLLLQAPA